MIYYIYLLEVGKAKYVGSTNNYKRRVNEHLKQLKQNSHVNDYLQSEYTRTKKFKASILLKASTLFKAEVLRDEQRYINTHSKCNEGVAAKITKYTRKEFMQDLIDFIVNNWRWLAIILVIVLVLGLNMSFTNASDFIFSLLDLYNRLGQ